MSTGSRSARKTSRSKKSTPLAPANSPDDPSTWNVPPPEPIGVTTDKPIDLVAILNRFGPQGNPSPAVAAENRALRTFTDGFVQACHELAELCSATSRPLFDDKEPSTWELPTAQWELAEPIFQQLLRTANGLATHVQESPPKLSELTDWVAQLQAVMRSLKNEIASIGGAQAILRGSFSGHLVPLLEDGVEIVQPRRTEAVSPDPVLLDQIRRQALALLDWRARHASEVIAPSQFAEFSCQLHRLWRRTWYSAPSAWPAGMAAGFKELGRVVAWQQDIAPATPIERVMDLEHSRSGRPLPPALSDNVRLVNDLCHALGMIACTKLVAPPSAEVSTSSSKVSSVDHTSGSAARESRDKNRDKPKKTSTKNRPLTKVEIEVADRFKKLQRHSKKRVYLTRVAAEYVKENGGSVATICRNLSAYPTQWKADKSRQTESGHR